MRAGTLAVMLALLAAPGALANPTLAPNALADAVAARIDGTYAVVLYRDGHRGMVPLSALTPEDQERAKALAQEHPLGHGNSKVTVTATVTEKKNTIQFVGHDGDTETVQLCAPSVLREQMGNTCELYAIVHCLDIAGFYVELPDIYKIINKVEATHPENPWANPDYARDINALGLKYTPPGAIHPPDRSMNAFKWVILELRKGHPVLAAFPESIWQGLPASFVAAHGWDGGKEGHAIVINGYKVNVKTGEGSFHIINSWHDLQEFDLSFEAANGLLALQWSLSAKGEVEPPPVKEVVKKVTVVKKVGTNNLYEVETNMGSHRILAPTEEKAIQDVENPDGR
jgi:hypothetical protein